MACKYSDFSPEDISQILHAKFELEQTFDTVSELIFIVDTESTITRANRSMAVRCGVPVQELVGKKCFEIIHGSSDCTDGCPLATVYERGEPVTFETSLSSLNGLFEVTMSPLYDMNRTVTGCVHVLYDITARRHSEAQLEEKQLQLESLNKSLETRIAGAVAELRKRDDILIQQSRLNAMGEMISAIAHQWRQPLNNVGLIVQGLQIAFKSNDLSVEELDKDIADTMDALQYISKTIDNFRNFFISGEEACTFTINDFFANALTFVEPILKKNGIRLELEEEPDVLADGAPNDYVQAFLNIVLNARDVLLERHVEQPGIAIRIFRENGRSVVTVRDNGGGIAEDVLPKIFDPYFSTKVQGSGAGIGLYMAKMVIEKNMHGSLTARNVDNGAEFRIEV